MAKGNIYFRLYEIKKEETTIAIEKPVDLWQNSVSNIKDFITQYFEKKNSYYKHLESNTLPDWRLINLKMPIESTISGKNISDSELKYLLDDFLKNWLSSQSFNSRVRDKYILIMYKKNEFFIIAHLSVKKSITLEWNNMEFANLLFSSDTLLRYIYVSKSEKYLYDMVFWEQTYSKTFLNYLWIDEKYFNKDYCWDINLEWKIWNTLITVSYNPTEFFNKYINKQIEIVPQLNFWKWNNDKIIKFKDESWLNITVSKFIVWKKNFGIDQILEMAFFEKLAINTALKDKESPLNELNKLNLFSNKTKIEENKQCIKIGINTIPKLLNNEWEENCIYFWLPLWNIKLNNYFMDLKFFEFICDSLFNKSNKKTIIYNIHESKCNDFFKDNFLELYKELPIYFPNLNLNKNIEINKEIQSINHNRELCDSDIMQRIYKIYTIITISFYVKDCKHLSAYFTYILSICFQKFAEIKSFTFSESENNTLEYKSGQALYFDKDRESLCYNRIKSDINRKIKNINPWCILYWFDENKREVWWIDKTYFKKFSDDIIHKFEEDLKRDCNLEDVRIYKSPLKINIIFVYIRKK